jgi:hypothetical protein
MIGVPWVWISNVSDYEDGFAQVLLGYIRDYGLYWVYMEGVWYIGVPAWIAWVDSRGFWNRNVVQLHI